MAWKRLTPQQVTERLAEKTGLPVEQVKEVLRAQAELAYAEASNGFAVPGIGLLTKKETPERRGLIPVGPKAGETILIRAKQVTKFRVSRLAKSMALDPSRPMPDIFKAPETPEFTFSPDAAEINKHSPLIANLGVPFAGGATDGESMRFYRLPDVYLPTGRICAADPMLLSGTIPFIRSVEPGRYPLLLAVVQTGAMTGLIAFAILRFSEKHVFRWEIASKHRDVPASETGTRDGYGVDSATGCFCDESIVQMLDAAEELDGEFFERLRAEMSESRKSGHDWISGESSSGSIAAFSSGGGDGFYASYFGLDKDANPAALVTDFQGISWPPPV